MTDLFGSRLLESLERQYDLYEPYRTICNNEKIMRAELRSIVERRELNRIPAIQSDCFKRHLSKGLFRKLSYPKGCGSWLMSSSTSGDPSCVWRTESDIAVARQSFSQLWGKSPTKRALYFAPSRDYLEKTARRLAFDEHPTNFFAVVPHKAAEELFSGNMTYMAQPSSAAPEKNGNLALELQWDTLIEAIERAEAERTPIGFCTFVLMLYPALKKLPRTYDLGALAFFVTGAGGWDGKKGTDSAEPIQKSIYVQEMSAKFNIPESAWESNFFDGYGTTESGKAFPGRYSREFGDFVYEVGDDAKVYVIDPIKGGLAKEGEQGFPRFITPYGVEGFAGVCVQHKDLVTVVSTHEDGSATRFTRIARNASSSESVKSPLRKTSSTAPAPKVDLVAILEAAGVNAEQRSRVVKAQQLLRTLPAEIPTTVKRDIVEAAFKAFDVPTHEIVAAASSEIDALKAFIREGEEHTQQMLTDDRQQIAKLESQIAAVRASMDRAAAEQEMRSQATHDEMRKVQSVLQFFVREPLVMRPSQHVREPVAAPPSDSGAQKETLTANVSSISKMEGKSLGSDQVS